MKNREQKYLPMSVEVLAGLFPAIWICGSLGLLYAFVALEQWRPYLIFGLFFWLYLAAPLVCRLVLMAYPIRRGSSPVGKKAPGHPWLFTFFLQQPYNSFPALERALRLIPGIYSQWLRLWGAKIGAGIIWTPRCQIVDRPLVSIGNRTIVGNESYIASHALIRKNGALNLFIAPVEIGSHCVLGLRSVVSPGTRMKDFTNLNAGEVAGPFKGQAAKARGTEADLLELKQ